MTVRLIRPEVNLDCKIQVPRTCFADPLAGGLVSGSVNAARVPTELWDADFEKIGITEEFARP